MQECSSPIRFLSVKPKKFSCNLEAWEVAVLRESCCSDSRRNCSGAKGSRKPLGDEFQDQEDVGTVTPCHHGVSVLCGARGAMLHLPSSSKNTPKDSLK